MSEQARPTVLVVDDEKEVADSYELRLEHQYDVRVAYDGESALETVEEADVDVVLLDRRMPGLTGDEVLREIRDRGHDCRVVMLTAVDPGFDAIDMPFDDYVCKPIDNETLCQAVEQQLRVVALEALSTYFELSAKREVLEAATSLGARANSERYQALTERVQAMETTLSDRLAEFDDLAEAFASVSREPEH